jgi:uncharacterized membrane protein YvbJ
MVIVQMSSDKTFSCPVCGADLKNSAKACYNCGSDDKTGWSEDSYLDGIELPFEDDEYEELRDKEFNNSSKNKLNWVTITGFILIVIFTILILKM